MWHSILWLSSSKADSVHRGVTGRPQGGLPTDTPLNYNISRGPRQGTSHPDLSSPCKDGQHDHGSHGLSAAVPPEKLPMWRPEQTWPGSEPSTIRPSLGSLPQATGLPINNPSAPDSTDTISPRPAGYYGRGTRERHSELCTVHVSARKSFCCPPSQTCWAKMLHFYSITRSLLGRKERREKCWPGGFQHV